MLRHARVSCGEVAMLRWTFVGGLAWLSVLSAGCGDDDGAGTKVSDIAGKTPTSQGTAATGDSPSIGISGDNTGRGASSGGGSGGNSAAGNGSAGLDDGNGNGNGNNGNAGDGSAGADDAGSASAGNGGNAGVPGSGGNASAAGRCNLVCALGTHCALVDVTCIQAPCNPVPQCVGNTGSAGTGGGTVGAVCGTRGAGPCADGQFCNHPIGADCGRADAPGSCEQIPSVCTREFQPVCGCDGATYSNACGAASAGVSIERDGEC
jgi:hypothetical protein